MNGNEVSLCCDLIYSTKLNTDFFRAFFRKERIVADNFHSEYLGAFGHLTADTSHSQNTKDLVAKLYAHKGFAIPFASYGFLVSLRDKTSHRHHHSKSMLTCGNGVAVWRIDH